MRPLFCGLVTVIFRLVVASCHFISLILLHKSDKSQNREGEGESGSCWREKGNSYHVDHVLKFSLWWCCLDSKTLDCRSW